MSFSSGRAGALLTGLMLGGCVATSESAKLADEVDQVRSGRSTFMQRTFMTMDEQCRSTRRPTATVVEAPKRGRVETTTQNATAIYEAGPYAHCNDRLGKALAFRYTSEPNYRGPDSFRVRVRYADGEIRHARYNIQVH